MAKRLIVGISGSPIKRNCAGIIGHCKERSDEEGFSFKALFLHELNIGPCVDCDFCRENESCSIDDDMGEAYGLLSKADGIIAASPVYFGSVSAQIKALFDRSRVLRRNGFKLRDKIGFGCAIGKSRNGGQETTLQAIHSWMHIHGMVVIGDDGHFGGALVDPFLADNEGILTVDRSIAKMVRLLKLK